MGRNEEFPAGILHDYRLRAMPLGVVDLTRVILDRSVRSGDRCVDATMGAGRDTVFLARLVGGTGHVFAFDVQTEAVRRTAELLERKGLADRVTLVRSGHEAAADRLPDELLGRVSAVTFNLGYLPGSDATVTTRPDTTLRGLDALWPYLAPGGVMTIVAYRGHEGGPREADLVEEWVRKRAETDAVASGYRPLGTTRPAPEAFLLRRTDDARRTERKSVREE